MKEVEGMKIKDISDCLNLSISNVKVRLHRAKNMLKEKFNESTSQKGIFEFGNSRCDRITERVMTEIL
jgi:RNA polymerase sigma-70 factor (ECF subfamily)